MAEFNKLKSIYQRKYKKLMLIPICILLFSVLILGAYKINTGEFIGKDVTLSGGTAITIPADQSIDKVLAKSALETELGVSVNIKELRSIGTAQTVGYVFEVSSKGAEQFDEKTLIPAIEKAASISIKSGDYSVEEMSPALGAAFWQSTIKAILLAFIFMAIVVFYYFRNLLVSGAIVLSVVVDLLGTLALMNIFGIRLSTAGVAALLMLIGYSVDTDILLSTRVLKRSEGTVLERIYKAMKTGFTMEATTFAVLAVMYIITTAVILKQIALILMLSIVIDTSSTWLMNAGLLRLYLKKKEDE